jgi:acyl-CoA thioester hydrolase
MTAIASNPIDTGMLATEYIVALAPFTVRRSVRWAECDPAGVVYLGNFPTYLLSAVHLFRDRMFGVGWIGADASQGYQAPGKALSMVFRGSLWPDDQFDMLVYVGGLRTRTMDLLVHASRVDNREDVFFGRVTSIFVTRDDRRATIAIPEEVRTRLDAYRTANPTPPVIASSLREPQ